MPRIRYLFLIMVLTVAAASVAAVEVDGLYTASVPVTSQSESERSRGVKKGLLQVIRKLTGVYAVDSFSGVSSAVASADSYMGGYSYELVPGEVVSGDQGLRLVVNFSADMLNRFLRVNRLPIWPSQREPLLIWVVMDDPESGRQLVGSETLADGYEVLRRLAEERGQPLAFPVLDLTDRVTLRPEDAWAFSEASITAASSRYRASNWVVFRLFQTSQGGWRGASFLGMASETSLTNIVEPDSQTFFSRGLSAAIDSISARQAYVPAAVDSLVRLTVDGIDGNRAYSDLTAMLANMEIVRDISLKQLKPGRALLNVQIEGDRDVFFAALDRSAVIRPADPEGGFGDRYIWVGN
ncbi:MAG: DUF2066 domain-containing protein [bacterium]